jgi:imidazolonepropionase-like amidohydrolase
MKHALACVLLITSACTAAPTPQEGPAPGGVAITHVSVIDATGAAPRLDQTVLIQGERIAAVGPSGSVRVPRGAEVVDARGKYLIPGLWDAHVHLSYAGECVLPLFVASGVTSVRDLGSRMDEIKAWRERMDAGELVGPRIKTAGPNLESERWLKGATEYFASRGQGDFPLWEIGPRVGVSSPEDAPAVLDSLVRMGVDFVKPRNISGATYRAVAAEAERRGLPLAGHAPAGLTLLEAARIGMDSFEHGDAVVFSDTIGLAERNEILSELARMGVFLVPTFISTRMYVSVPDSLVLAFVADTLSPRDPRRRLVTRRQAATWYFAVASKHPADAPPDFERMLQEQREAVRAAHQAGVKLMAGSDFGGVPLLFPGSSLHEELELLVGEAGLTPMEALQSATRNPPMFFDMEEEMGTIEAGKLADLVLLDENPLEDIRNMRSIRAIVVQGKLLNQRELNTLKEGAVAAIQQPGMCDVPKVSR